jgi:hypothetical protein
VTAPAVVVLTLTLDELRALFRAELDSALAAVALSTPTPLLTIDALAHAESCSRATIRRLMRDGAPHTYLAASPRFDLTQWRAWCAERGRRGTKAKPSSGPIAGVRLLGRRAR